MGRNTGIKWTEKENLWRKWTENLEEVESLKF